MAFDRGRIEFAGQATISEDVSTIDVDGFLMPGAVDRHVHIGLSEPAAVLAGGVVAVRDLGWPPTEILPLADASESPGFEGPLIRAVGPILTCRGGYPSRAGWAPAGTALEVGGPDLAAAATTRVLDDTGVPVVKVALNAEAGPTLSDEELVAICDTAHRRQAIVTCHVEGRAQVERALGAGVDELAHCPWSEPLSEDLAAAVASRMRIVSTLDIHSFGEDTPDLRRATENLNRFLQAGGTATYGTDLGNGDIPAGIHVGEAWHLRRAGLSPEGVLEAMTFRPLESGEPADLIALGGDPLEDLDALGDVRLVVRSGRIALRR
ncbi:MAG: amidohydrolase family protein [Actinomycetota bacterium]